MRSLLWLAAVFTSLALALIGCSGDDTEPQPSQAAQPQSEQAEQPQAVSAARPQPAPSQSDQADQAEQSAQADAADEQSEAEADETEISDPLLAEATAAYEAWVDDLETMELDITADFVLFGLEVRMPIAVVFRTDPPAMWMTMDASGLLSAAVGTEAESDAAAAMLETFAEMQVLATDDGFFMTFPGLGGWIDLSESGDPSFLDLTALLNQTGILDTVDLGQALRCEDGTYDVTLDRLDGENVWLVNCEIEDTVLAATVPSGQVGDASLMAETEIESMQLRLAISRETGAPLRTESDIVFADALGGLVESSDGDAEEMSFRASGVSTLRSWNEPVTIPAPTPLVDIAALGALFSDDSDADANPGSDAAADASDELLTQDELLALVSAWVESVDELHLESAAQAVIDGESRLATTVVRSSRAQGVFETEVVIDSAGAFRLHWNREGAWVSDETTDGAADGAAVWEPLNPALLGFAETTVDEFLARPNRIDLSAYAALLDLSWLTRTISGGGPPVYELVIESGPRMPGGDFFDELVAVLKAETASLLAENVSFDAIEHFSTVITILGDNGQLVSQTITAEFSTSAGSVELVASHALVSGEPLEFSSPGE